MRMRVSPGPGQLSVYLTVTLWAAKAVTVTPHRATAQHTWRPDSQPDEFDQEFPNRYWQFGQQIFANRRSDSLSLSSAPEFV